MNYLPSTMAEFDAIVKTPETVPTHVLEETFMWLNHMNARSLRGIIREMLLKREDRIAYRESQIDNRPPKNIGELMDAGVPLETLRQARCVFDKNVFGNAYDRIWEPKPFTMLRADEKDLEGFMDYLTTEHPDNPAAEEALKHGEEILELLKDWRNVKKKIRAGNGYKSSSKPPGRPKRGPSVTEILLSSGGRERKTEVRKRLESECGIKERMACRRVQEALKNGLITENKGFLEISEARNKECPFDARI